MREEDKLILFFGWSTLIICVIVLMGKVTYEMDQINKKLDDVSHDIANVNSDIHTLTTTETITTEATTEPSTISMTLKYENNVPENAQESREELSESTVEQLTTESSKTILEPSRTYLGIYELTAYDATGNPCANGNYPTCGYTVASNSIPMGSRIYIEGYGEYVVEDCGAMSDNVIDVYMGDYDTCIQFGRRSAKVYLIN